MNIRSKLSLATAFLAGAISWHVDAAMPTSGTYAVLTSKDYNADALYVSSLPAAEQPAVTSDPDYGKGFFGSSLTANSKVNRWTLYREGVADQSAEGFFPPNASYDYWIYDKTFTTPNGGSVSGTYAFPGKSLTLSQGGISHCSKGTTLVDLGDDVRIFGNCSYSFPARGSADPQTRAVMTIDAAASISISASTAGGSSANKSVYGIDWSVTAPSTAAIRMKNGKNCYTTWHWWGDCSKFDGTLYVDVNDDGDADHGAQFVLCAPLAGTVSVAKWNSFSVDSASATLGTLVVEGGGILSLEADNTAVIGTLQLKAGAVIDVGDVASGAARVTTAVSAVRPVQVRLPSVPEAVNRGILTVPSASAVTADDFVLYSSYSPAAGTPDFAVCAFRDNGDGTKTLWVSDATPTGTGVGRTLEVYGSSVLTNADSSLQVRVKTGGSLVYEATSAKSAQMPVYVESGADLRLGKHVGEWQNLPILWLDASVADTMRSIDIIYEDSCVNYDHVSFLQMNQTIADADGNPFVKGWFDWRPTQQSIKMWNERYDCPFASGDLSTHNVMSFTHPRCVRGGLNGLNYLSFDRPSVGYSAAFVEGGVKAVSVGTSVLPRIYFKSYDAAVTETKNTSVSPRYAFLVYGSAQGGGGALLGGNANFLRAGTVGNHTKDDAILASNAFGARVWLDGTEVDPTTTGFNGAWQVVTVDFGSLEGKFNGLGYGSGNGTDNGGQAYAEVILVTQEITDSQRQAIEIYLAEKWGLQDQYAYPATQSMAAAIYGDGDVDVDGNLTLSGGFAGDINIHGNTLTIEGTDLPPTDAVVDTSDMSGWYDPEWAGSLEFVESTAARPKSPSTRVNWLYDRRCGGTAQDGFYALTGNGSDRAPWLDASSHGFGPVRNWIDYSNVGFLPWTDVADSSINNGNTMRFRVASGGKWTGNFVSNHFRTVVMVQDSKNGGGQPFVDGDTVLPSAAATLYKTRLLKTAESPIYPSGTSAVLTEGTTRLDGEVVNGSEVGFHGRPEVLTVQTAGDYAPVCFEHLNNSERRYGADTRSAIQGEILMWTRLLGETELNKVEAYLSWKWLGILRDGYVSLTNATVFGSGLVRAESVRVLPKFDSSFSGTVELLGADGLAFEVSTEGGETTVPDAISLGQGSLAASGTVNLTLTAIGKNPQAGEYRLISWAQAPAGVEEWKLTFVGFSDSVAGNCKVKSMDTGLFLEVGRRGVMILFR